MDIIQQKKDYIACPCCQCQETAQHILLACPFTKAIWFNITDHKLECFFNINFQEQIKLIMNTPLEWPLDYVINIIIYIHILWHSIKTYAVIFQGSKFNNPSNLASSISNYLGQIINIFKLDNTTYINNHPIVHGPMQISNSILTSLSLQLILSLVLVLFK